MKESGINVNMFGSHSARQALTLKCKMFGLSFKDIADGWMKELLHNFMIAKFKRTIQTIYLDEVCCFLYV